MGQMRAADFADNGQAQATPRHLLVTSIKPLKHSLPVFIGNARAVVFNFQHRWQGHPQDHIAPGAGVRQCVVDQVAQ